jgi:hypothetical protein
MPRPFDPIFLNHIWSVLGCVFATAKIKAFIRTASPESVKKETWNRWHLASVNGADAT